MRKLECWIRRSVLTGSTPSATDPAEFPATTKMLGHSPRWLRDYVRDAVAGGR